MELLTRWTKPICRLLHHNPQNEDRIRLIDGQAFIPK